VAIPPPKYNSQGYTLVEMLVVLTITGVFMGIALPSFLALNKPLRDGSSQFKSHLTLIRSKAISTSQAYRIKPKHATAAAYSNGIAHNFVVEYAANCKVANANWKVASELDLDLPLLVGITNVASSTFAAPVFPVTGTITNSLAWNICFDSRGIVDTITQIVLKDFQGNNKAQIAVFSITKVGNVDFYPYAKNTTTSYAANTDLKDGQTPSQPLF
jgi:prepilin-type N-terminal cleavage/methylation domain-containing protein